MGPATAAAAAALAALGGADPAADELARLRQQQIDLAAQRRATAKALAREERKRKRALDLARGLSDEDLIGIIASRASAKAKAKAKAEAKGKAKAKAKAKAALAPALPAAGEAGAANEEEAAEEEAPLVAP